MSRVTVKVISSPSDELASLMVTAALSLSSASVILVPVTVRFVPLPDIVIVSLPSTALSFVGVRVKVYVPVFLVAAIVIVKSATVA